MTSRRGFLGGASAFGALGAFGGNRFLAASAVCAGGGAFTERELAECGVKLVVPALRTRVFELRPL